jgi:hypothetical protein
MWSDLRNASDDDDDDDDADDDDEDQEAGSDSGDEDDDGGYGDDDDDAGDGSRSATLEQLMKSIHRRREKARSRAPRKTAAILRPTMMTMTTTSASIARDEGHVRSFSFFASMARRAGAGGRALDRNVVEFHSFRADSITTASGIGPKKILKQIASRNGGGGSIVVTSSSKRWIEAECNDGRKLGGVAGYGDGLNPKRSFDPFRSCYAAFLLQPYDEASYRARMKPPLAGLISILSSSDLKIRQPSFSLALSSASSSSSSSASSSSSSSSSSASSASCTIQAMLMNHHHRHF